MIVVKNDAKSLSLKLIAASVEPCSSLLTLAASVLVQSYLLSRVATLGELVLLRALLKRLQWHSK